MAIQLGYNSYLGFTEVATTGSYASVAAEFIYCNSFSFKREREETVIDELTGSRTLRRRSPGQVTANGTFTRMIDTQNGIGLYKHLLTGSLTSATQTTNSATFDHTFSEGDELPSGVRLQFETSVGGGSATTLRWYNGVVESYSLNVGIGSMPQETWNFRFADHTAAVNTVATVAFTQEPPMNFHQVSLRLGATVTAVSDVVTRDITLNVSNNTIEDYRIGTATSERFSHGLKEVNGSFNVVFEDLNLYNNFINNTANAMVIFLQSDEVTSATNHSISFNLPQVHFNGETAEVGDNGEIIQPINFTAIYGSNAGYQLQVVCVNGNASVPLN
jgi:hypothetical protein